MKNNILITGGAGFIGSHLVRLFVNKYPEYNIFNIDNLSYASDISNLREIDDRDNYNFIKGDICDYNLVKEIFFKYKINKVIHLAAESHVDRSIMNPISFANTNVIGTLNLLMVAKEIWDEQYCDNLFYNISTDEVYGSLGEKGLFNESARYSPNSPYAASKASADHFVRSFSKTYGIPVIISNCSNNYGPFQFPEKLVPLFICNIIENRPLTLYGNGENIRDWLYVEDHIKAIDLIFHKGNLNQTYNIGGFNEWKNIDLTKLIIKITDRLIFRNEGFSNNLISFVEDRKGHDFRYAIDSSKIKNELGWSPSVKMEDGLETTIKWYIQNKSRLKI